MGQVRNVLFIMCDQLRADYLGYAGHPALRTPHIDALARRGVAFRRAYCQAPICGPSRMSFYTGRYMTSHGATWNGVPLDVGELTLGDYMRPLGVRTALVGKTHMSADRKGLARVGLDPKTGPGRLIAECGFEPFERDDGLHPDQLLNPDLAYNAYLRAQGYDAHNPWHDFANAAEGPDGELISGWYLRSAPYPARVAEEHSETAYMTDRAMAFVRDAGDTPWCLHLSYIKPHWPYIAPAPYDKAYSADDVLPANRDAGEREAPHPVIGAFMQHAEGQSFASEDVRRAVIPAYMGLIEQIDQHIGRLMSFLDSSGRLDDTLIVFTSDHGDYLGDHWLGEKELFHEESARVPLVVVDPDSRADGTRGTTEDALVETIDLVPTFIDACGGTVADERLEGCSLLPIIRGDAAADRRDAVFSEADYAFRGARRDLGLPPDAARAYMVRTDRWKYVHYDGFRPQLFDLEDDPQERHDRGADPATAAVRTELNDRLFTWLRQRRVRQTMANADVERRTDNAEQQGFIIGQWSPG